MATVHDYGIICEFPGELGHASIPASQLSKLPTGATVLEGQVYTQSTVHSGGFSVRVRASANMAPGGSYPFQLE